MPLNVPPRRPANATRRGRLAVAAGLLLALGTGGCYYPGGPGYSADTFTYESTSWQPWTVTVVDTRTGQTIWSVDVPVGKQLVVAFKPDRGNKDTGMPDLMQWEIFPLGTRTGTLTNSLVCPPAGSRRLDPTLRPTPELPEDMAVAAPVRPPVVVEPSTK
jgi:hypothetical protein